MKQQLVRTSPIEVSAMPMTRHDRKGFTLVELMVVVAVIGLLISILLPSLKKAREQAKRTVCSTRLRELANGIWNYQVESNGRLPYIESPMTNGSLVPGFGDQTSEDDEIDPFNRNKEEKDGQPKGWPYSLPNVLMPTHVGADPKVFVCPSALVGWPRQGGPFRMTYRPAAANQPNGLRDENSTYLIEHFGFMDGRTFRAPRPYRYTGDIITDMTMSEVERGVFLRDLVQKKKDKVVGPHCGGNNVVNKRLEVEFRDEKRINEDLCPFSGMGVSF